jgi:tripartite-type tricarboxylate transporter receptor subunit TctC
MRFLLIALAAFAAQAAAQSYPSKPVRLIAPYAAGGAVDLMARYLCAEFQKTLGQPCVVENRTGAGGMIGFEQVARSDPDGHTLALAPNNFSIIPALYSKVPYDTVRDFAPVALVSRSPIMIGVHPSFEARTFAEFIAHARANSGKLNFTTCGPASPQHIAGEMLAAQGGFRWTHVPYKGCGAAFADVLAGRVPVFISTVAHFNPQIKLDKLRGLAVLGAERSSFAPEYPTVAESGFPGYQVDVWFGLLAPAKTPPEILARLNAEVNKALEQPALREKLLAGFYEPLGGTPQRFAQVIAADIARMGKVIREIGITAE